MKTYFLDIGINGHAFVNMKLNGIQPSLLLLHAIPKWAKHSNSLESTWDSWLHFNIIESFKLKICKDSNF